jgi:hypothetical protein
MFVYLGGKSDRETQATRITQKRASAAFYPRLQPVRLSMETLLRRTHEAITFHSGRYEWRDFQPEVARHLREVGMKRQ